MKQKLKNIVIGNIFDRLVELDGPPAKPGEPASKPPFKFSGKTLYNLAKNLKACKEALQTLEDTKAKIIAAHKEEGKEKLEGEAYEKANAEFIKVMNEPVEIEFHKIKIADLDLDNNQVPMRILVDLDGIIFVEELPAS